MKYNDELWAVDDRDKHVCIRHGYNVVTLKGREYVANFRWEDDAKYVVCEHNEKVKIKK